MRSDLIFGALAYVSNRYQLCQLASKATRKLHRPNERLEDTANQVMLRFHDSNPGVIRAVDPTSSLPVASASAVRMKQRRAA